MSYKVAVRITDGDNTMISSYDPILADADKLKDAINNLLRNQKDVILEKFPTNQWIYQWIISEYIDGSLESFMTAFGVTGDRKLINALIGGSTISYFEPGEYVLSFEGY